MQQNLSSFRGWILKTGIPKRKADSWRNVEGGVAVVWEEELFSALYSDIQAFLCSFFEFRRDFFKTIS